MSSKGWGNRRHRAEFMFEGGGERGGSVGLPIWELREGFVGLKWGEV